LGVVTNTVAVGTALPDGSVTCPRNVEVFVWAASGKSGSATNKAKTEITAYL
jgi:hypothetical protein